ncbi:MAG: AAA family ATPase [Pelodictyon phaeoclathratiforme]
MKGAIKKISISGFKSIRELKEFELRDLNIIIGANGSGKSNFVQVFKGYRRFILLHPERVIVHYSFFRRC